MPGLFVCIAPHISPKRMVSCPADGEIEKRWKRPKERGCDTLTGRGEKYPLESQGILNPRSKEPVPFLLVSLLNSRATPRGRTLV
jgi:hypothetical protein